jgi:uncharacterized membrane protein (DUF373 family)
LGNGWGAVSPRWPASRVCLGDRRVASRDIERDDVESGRRRPRRGVTLLPIRPFTVDSSIAGAEGWIYLIVTALLLVGAGFLVVGTVTDIVEHAASRSATGTGIFVLERVLLLFIMAEILYTVRLLDFGGRILVEPFLFIGLIAVVRRVLVVTAEAEGTRGRGQAVDFVIQIGGLGALGLVLSLSIYLLRRSGGT